jgi:hypothetical protein
MNEDSDESEADTPSDRDPMSSRKERQDTFTLGTYCGRRVLISIRQIPAEGESPEEFAANLYIPADKDVSIFRVDTAHSGCHADRLYLPKKHPQRREDYSVEFYHPKEVVEELSHNSWWRDLVEQYESNHGLPPRRGRD